MNENSIKAEKNVLVPSHLSESTGMKLKVPQSAESRGLQPMDDQIWLEFEKRIEHRLVSNQELASIIAGRLIKAGGKRIRARVCLLTSRLFGAVTSKELDLAVAVELIHSATLLHDDVVDGSDKRRGVDSANHLYGNAAPVLVGDFLFSRAFRAMVATDSTRVLETLAIAAEEITESEIHQLTLLYGDKGSLDDYLTVIKGKTAALFAAASEAPTLLAGHDDLSIHLRNYGHYFGMAFQMMNDVLDYLGRPDELGRKTGEDFREGKRTLPFLIHQQRIDSDEERAFWDRVQAGSESQGDLCQAITYMRNSGALDDAVLDLRRNGEKALEALEAVPAGPARDELADLVRKTTESLEAQ